MAQDMLILFMRKRGNEINFKKEEVMKKEIILLTLMLLFASYSFADIIHVPGDQPTIQAAINIAEDDDIVLVDDGIYVENINFYGKVITVGSLYLTTGDINHITQTIIDGSANGSVVTFNNDEETGSVLIGFTITNGNAESGGGIYISEDSEPTLNNLYVFGNTATDGGGLYFLNSEPDIINLKVYGNTAFNNGGGIFISEESEPNLIMTVIENNSAVNGGGIYLCDDSALNSIYVRISANIALNGGGIYCDGIGEDMGHIIINENTATMHGGGLYFLDSETDVINLTVFGNTATNGGGIYSDISNPVLTDCIFWNDTPQEIVGPVEASYSDIQGGWPGIGNLEIIPNFTPSSNFHLDPFNTAGDDKNPLIDAGDPDSDYDEEPEPNGSRINMGAYGNTEMATISINVPPANIVGNVTWTNDYLYLLGLDLTITDDAFLTIETGTKIEVEEGNVIYVNGTIDASAIAGDSILISPDTGYLGRNSRNEVWDGIVFENNAAQNSVLNSVVMENAINGIEINGVDVDIINSKILFNQTIGVTSETGIIVNHSSDVVVYNCDIEGYQTGIEIINNLPLATSTPTVTNTRVRNSPESSREDEIGINISGNVVAYIDSCDIVGCPYGIRYVGTATATTSTPTVTNTRVRNSPESSRTSLISGIYIDSLFTIEINNCDIEHCQTGIEIVNNLPETTSTPTVTNTRVRNSPESSRDVFVGIKIIGNIEGIITKNEMAFCDTAIIILGDLANLDINNNLIYLDDIPTMSDVAIFAIGSDNLSISNNTIYDYLIGFVSESTVTHFFNNIIWNEDPSGIPIQESSSSLTVEYNDIIMATGVYPGTGNINEDPLFVNPLQVDFHLQADSPCIDAGDPDTDISDYTTDLDGNPRIRNAIIDMGTYEYQSGGITAQNIIPENNNQSYEFTNTGTTIQFSGNHVETTINATKYNTSPGVIGNLPDGVENISSDRYWNLYSTEGNVGNYNVTFDLSGVSGIQNFNTLHILKRDNSSSAWQDVVTDLGFTLTYNEPYITVNGLTSFSDFGIGGSSDNYLPVELSSFSAQFVNDNLTILWTTQSETNNQGWYIYRGESVYALENDETTQINVALIEGAGNSTEPTDYSFHDQYPVVENNTYWYWLESVSYSNDTGIYGPISLTIPEEDNNTPELPCKTMLYGNHPNPFNPLTNIQFDIKKNETGVLSIFNLKGQIIESHEFNSGKYDYSWNAKDQCSGIYFYKLKAVDYQKVRKMILLK